MQQRQARWVLLSVPTTALEDGPLDGIPERATELGSRIAVTIAVILAVWVIGRVLRLPLRWYLDRRGRPSYTRVLVGLFGALVGIIGVLFAITLAFPSVEVADVLAIFGILSVAAGFAFKDAFENLLAGVLLLLRDPFRSGDQITAAGHSGTVRGVTVRETLLETSDGTRVVIPNAKVVGGPIVITTHHPVMRSSFSVWLQPTADLPTAAAIAESAMERASGVEATPPPTARHAGVTPDGVEMCCRFWSGSHVSQRTDAIHAAIGAVIGDLRQASIPLAETGITIAAPRGGGDSDRQGDDGG